MLGALGGCKWKASVDFQINGGGSSQFLRGREKSVQTNVCEFLRRHRKSSDGNSALSCSHRFALFLIYFLWCVFVKTVDDSFVCSHYTPFLCVCISVNLLFLLHAWFGDWRLDTKLTQQWYADAKVWQMVIVYTCRELRLEQWESKSKHTRA